jgi:hypothetical protein
MSPIMVSSLAAMPLLFLFPRPFAGYVSRLPRFELGNTLSPADPGHKSTRPPSDLDMIELSQFFVNSAIDDKMPPIFFGEAGSAEVLAQIDEEPSSKVMVFLLHCGGIALIHPVRTVLDWAG